MKAFGLALVLLGLAGGLVFTTGACGTGGGAVVVIDPVTLWSGTYFLLAFTGDDGAPDLGRTLWGTVISDGAGNVAGGSTEDNENGVIGAPVAITGFTYSVDAANRLTWLSAGLPAFQGGVTADGRAALLGTLANGVDPFIFLLCKKEGTFNNASLNATYHACVFFHNSPDDGARFAMTKSFDGAGTTLESAGMENLNGAVGAIGGIAGTYVVMADGTVTLEFQGQPMSGGILMGGDLVIAAGGITGGDVPALLVLVRQGAGLTNAIFSGNYHTVSIIAPNGGVPEWRSTTRTATGDGAGTINVGAGVTNDDGVPGASGAFADTYAVAGDGTFTIGGGVYVGGISPTGNFAVFAGGTGGGSSPEMHILFR